jgi:hypothetical protein
MASRGGGGTAADGVFADALAQPDVAAAVRQLRAAVLELSSGRYQSSALRAALYGEFLLKLLDRVFGEHSDYSAPASATCWLDAVDGVRLQQYREARLANDTATLHAMGPVEQSRCQVRRRRRRRARVDHTPRTRLECLS